PSHHYTLSLHDALPISSKEATPIPSGTHFPVKQTHSFISASSLLALSTTRHARAGCASRLQVAARSACRHRSQTDAAHGRSRVRSEEHTSELQSRENLV